MNQTQPIAFVDGEIVVDAKVLAPLLRVAAGDVPDLMRRRAITSICERGLDVDAGQFRLSFFYRNRRVRLNVDSTGRIVRRTAVDFGDRDMPAQLHRPGC